jgi:uncharacterized protein
MGNRSTRAGSATAGVGLAYCSYVPTFIEEHPGAADFVELPFERLQTDPGCIAIAETIPVVLHSASLSMAGTVDAPVKTVRSLADWIRASRTPWVGEHLAFVTAPSDDGSAYNVGYTVTPPFNNETLARVVQNVRRYARRFGVPVLLENPPQYFETPGSTMSQLEFISALCDASPTISLLLDLTHLQITADNVGFDARAALARFPLDRVVEVHVSGIAQHGGSSWDDHAERVPARVLELARVVGAQPNVRAVTLEYNWSSRFPPKVVAQDLAALREAFAQCCGPP